MATEIQWTSDTWNPVRGCSRVSDGCDNCYAIGQAHRFSGPGQPYEGLTVLRPKSAKRPGVDWSGIARLHPEMLDKPLRWRKSRRVFVNSMSDLFHHSLSNEDIAAVFGVMAACPQHTFQVLTKRPERMRSWFTWASTFNSGPLIGPSYPAMHCNVVATEMLGAVPGSKYGPWADCGLDIRSDKSDPLCFEGVPWPLPNVHLGVSVEDQETADERIPKLLLCPAAVRFISAEPLLGAVDLTAIRNCDEVFAPCNALAKWDTGERVTSIEWVITGGESGHGARQCNVEWIRDIVRQCRRSSVPADCCCGREFETGGVVVKVIIESPLGGKTVDERRENLRYLLWCCRSVYLAGYRPIASHLVCPMFMDDADPKERADGIDWPWMWEPGVRHWFFDDRGMSPGMVLAEQRCRKLGIGANRKTLYSYQACWVAFNRGEWPPNTFGLGELLTEKPQKVQSS